MGRNQRLKSPVAAACGLRLHQYRVTRIPRFEKKAPHEAGLKLTIPGRNLEDVVLRIQIEAPARRIDNE